MNFKLLKASTALSAAITHPRNNNLGLIRLVAAFMVMQVHCQLRAGTHLTDYYNHFHPGFIGLPSFFFLSGLLVTQSLYKSKGWWDFCRRRFLRIYPAAIFTILATTLLIGPFMTTLPLRAYFADPLTREYLLSCILVHIHFKLPGVFIDSPLGTRSVNASLWTIALELKLYAGLLLASMIRIPGKRHVLSLLIAALIIGNLLISKNDSNRAILPYFSYGTQFLAGVWCYLFRERIFIPRWWWLAVPAGWALCLWIDLPALLHTAAYFLIPATVLTLATHGVRQLRRVTPRADLSYGIYCWAFPVEQLVANLLRPDAGWLFILTALFTVSIAVFSWWMIEKPALRLK